MADDVDTLRQFAFTATITQTLSGRQPPETAYLRELALLLEEYGQKEEAARAWHRFQQCLNLHEDDGVVPTVEDLLHHARLLVDMKLPAKAREVLTAFTCSTVPTESEDEAAAQAETAYARLCNERIGGDMPVAIGEFLSRAWPKVLQRAFLAGGVKGTPWALAVQTLSDLLWTLTPKRDADERSRMVNAKVGPAAHLSRGWVARWPRRWR